MRSAGAVERLWRERQTLEVVWTGPKPASSTLRRTDQALLEVIEAAQSELWIVCFAVYRLNMINRALGRAIDRKVRVHFVMETSDESGGRLTSEGTAALDPAMRTAASIYVWPESKRPLSGTRKGLLHAKCALADDRLLFVSSANLSQNALELNMELGLLVRGGPEPGETGRHLRWLVQSGVLMPAGP